MKIEDFKTSVASDPNLKPVNLDPKENIKIKNIYEDY